MEKNNNRLMTMAYKLYATTGGRTELVEEAGEDRPFTLISGMGLVLEAFEQAVRGLHDGEHFDFTLTPAEAYGDYLEERVVDMDRHIFCIDGKEDERYLHVGAAVPLRNESGQRFTGHVKSVGTDTVQMDFNHPLAGKSLRFEGHIIESREIDEQELKKALAHAKGCGGCGGSCGGGCGSEDGGCGGCGSEDGGCGGCEHGAQA